MTKVSVVILNYNGKNFLEKFLSGVVQNSKGAEVVVADNHSTDDSLEYLATHHPDVRVIAMNENRGFSGGYNEALKQVEAKYYVILNSDVEVTPGWIDPIINYMDEYEEVAACQPKIMSYHQKSHFEYAGAAGGFIDTLGYPFCRGRVFLTLEEDLGQYDDMTDIFWATGACLFVRSDVFHQAGEFDEDYFAHMEEIDLCWRINLAGYRICYLPQSKVYHVGGGTLPKENPRKTYLNFRNSLATLYKNSNDASLSWKLPVRLLLDIIAAMKFMVTDGFDSFAAVVRANMDFYFGLNKYRQKRKMVQSIAKKKIILPYKGILVIDYYLNGKRKFSDLNIHR